MKKLIAIASSIAVISSLGAKEPVSAQVQVTRQVNPVSPDTRTAVQAMQPVTFQPIFANQGNNRSEAVIATSKPLGQTSLLSSFLLNFENGDHKIRRIAIVPDDRTMIASLADSNGDDPFAAGATWHIPSHGAVGGSVTQAGGGVFDIDIPRGPAGSVLILSGFDFKRARDSDANIRSFAIKLDSATAKARVTLLDDQGMDFTALAGAAAIGFGFGAIGGGPIGVLGAGHSSFGVFGGFSAPGGARRANPYRRYTATIHYAWVPAAALRQEVSVTGTGTVQNRSSGTFPNGAAHVLTGFSFHSQNSDHYLLKVGTHLNGIRQDLGGSRYNGVEEQPVGYMVSWQDNNTDDPIQWSADYRQLNQR